MYNIDINYIYIYISIYLHLCMYIVKKNQKTVHLKIFQLMLFDNNYKRFVFLFVLYMYFLKYALTVLTSKIRFQEYVFKKIYLNNKD